MVAFFARRRRPPRKCPKKRAHFSDHNGFLFFKIRQKLTEIWFVKYFFVPPPPKDQWLTVLHSVPSTVVHRMQYIQTSNVYIIDSQSLSVSKWEPPLVWTSTHPPGYNFHPILKISFWPSGKNKWVLTQILIDSDSGHIKLIIGRGLDVWFRYLWIWKRNFWLYLKGSLRRAVAARAAT